MVKYLGELYNYRMVESSIIFKTLYSIISYAVTLDGIDSCCQFCLSSKSLFIL